MTEKTARRTSVQTAIATVLFITLFLSLVFSLWRFFTAPVMPIPNAPYRKIKSDYLLMSMQCASGLIVMMLPTFINRRWKLVVPDVMCVLYYVFLYFAVFLGEIFSFYYKIPYWDVFLHAMSGAMLGALGFILIDWLNTDPHVRLSASPLFISLFAFSFALSIGALWEIYEFSFDSVFGLNMQKFRAESGEIMVGREALLDTMKDLITDAASAFTVATVGFIKNHTKKKHREKNYEGRTKYEPGSKT